MTKPGHRPAAAGPSPTHVCPGGCTRIVAAKYFACRSCWYRLPFAIRQAINANYGRDQAAHTAAMAEAIRWYRSHVGVRT